MISFCISSQKLPAVVDIVVFGSPVQITLLSDGLYASREEESWLRLGIDSATAPPDFDVHTTPDTACKPLLPGGVPLLKSGVKIEISENSTGYVSHKIRDFIPLQSLWKCVEVNTNETDQPVANTDSQSDDILKPSTAPKQIPILPQLLSVQEFDSSSTPISTSIPSTPISTPIPSTPISASSHQSAQMARPLDEGNSSQVLELNKINNYNKESFLVEAPVADRVALLLDDLRRFDSLGVTNRWNGRKLTALKKHSSPPSSIYNEREPESQERQIVQQSSSSIESSEVGRTPCRRDEVRVELSVGAPKELKRKEKEAVDHNGEALRPSDRITKKDGLVHDIEERSGIDSRLLISEAGSNVSNSRPLESRSNSKAPSSSKSPKASADSKPSSASQSPKSPKVEKLSVDMTSRMVRANDLHHRLLSRIRISDEKKKTPPSDIQNRVIPRIGGHRETDYANGSPKFDEKKCENVIDDGRNVFVLRIQISDSKFEELRFAEDSDIKEVRSSYNYKLYNDVQYIIYHSSIAEMS